MECEQAKDGFAKYSPIVNALELYKNDNGQYPSSLNQLTPKYLDHLPDLSNHKLSYINNENSYELRFTYYGPGVNDCVYTPEHSSWKCNGYF